MVPEVILTALFVGWLLKGKLTRLVDVKIKYAWLVFVPLGLHILVMIANSAHAVPEHSILYSSTHVIGFLALLVLALANSRLPGVKVMIAGIAANLVALVANGGMMPASKEVIIAVMGKHELDSIMKPGLLRHAFIDGTTKFRLLCDVIGLRRPYILMPGVYSIGDILTTLGFAIALIAIMCKYRMPEQKVARQG